jgi:serine/threonine-protein kinase RsbW
LYKPALQADLVYAVELSLSEACTNAIKHAMTAAALDNLTVNFEVFMHKLCIVVKDQGHGYDMNNIALPDFDEHPEGGYGIFIIKSMMDEVQYFHSDGFNHLKMIKYLE